MRITLAVNSDLLPDKVGGRTKRIKEELKKRGHNVKVIHRSSSLIHKFRALFHNFWKIYVNPNYSPTEKLNAKFDKIVCKKLKPCEVLHCWDYLPNTLARAKSLGITTVIDIQMAPVGNYMTNPMIDYVLCPSEFARESCLKIGIKENKLINVPFGADLLKFYPGEKWDKKFTVLFVGSVCERKGVSNLLRAWEYFIERHPAEVQLLLAGRAFKGFKKQIKHYKFAGHIGFLKYKSLLSEYQKANVLVLPSSEEGSAKVTYESLASGLPVLCTFESGSLVHNGVGRIIKQDYESILNGLEFIFDLWKNQRNVYNDFCRESRELMKTNTWDVYKKEVVDVYEKVSSY